MFYQLVLIMPFLAIASCIALLVCVVMILTRGSLLSAKGFAVHERSKTRRASGARTPLLQPSGCAPQRAFGVRT